MKGSIFYGRIQSHDTKAVFYKQNLLYIPFLWHHTFYFMISGKIEQDKADQIMPVWDEVRAGLIEVAKYAITKRNNNE